MQLLTSLVSAFLVLLFDHSWRILTLRGLHLVIGIRNDCTTSPSQSWSVTLAQPCLAHTVPLPKWPPHNSRFLSFFNGASLPKTNRDARTLHPHMAMSVAYTVSATAMVTAAPRQFHMRTLDSCHSQVLKFLKCQVLHM